jgi:acetyl esterase/lipase
MPSKESEALGNHWRSLAQRMAANPHLDITSLRAVLDELQQRASEPTGVTYEEVEAAGRRALWANPIGAAQDRVILFLHGGGFIGGSIECHRKMAAHFAKAAGCRSFLPDYRLAPEHAFPAQLQDCVAAYHWLLAQGFQPGHIATAGDSAGGNLATSICLKLRDEGSPQPAAIIAISPWYDMESNGPSMATNAGHCAIGRRETYEMISAMLLKGHSPKDPLANPLYADPAGLPPIYLSGASEELLLDNSQRFAAIAQKAGVDVTIDIAEGMHHVYEFMAGRAPEADQAIAAIARWVRPRLGL